MPRAAGSRCTASCGPSQNRLTDRQAAQPTNIFTSTASSRNHACHLEKGSTEAKKPHSTPKLTEQGWARWETATADKNLEAHKMSADSAGILVSLENFSKKVADTNYGKGEGFEAPSALPGCRAACLPSYGSGETETGASWSLWVWLKPARGIRGEITLKQCKLGWNPKADELLLGGSAWNSVRGH